MAVAVDEHPADFPLPDQEEQRLKALYQFDVLDTPADDQFDRLTETAERELDVAVAAVTFIDKDRQFVKSCAGAPAEDSPRGESYCTYTILSDEVTVVEDSRDDPRFGEDYAVVNGQEVRSYAGYPLVTEEGHRLGSFCVFDFKPRTFSDSDLDLLRLLRDQAMALITTHQHEKRLRELALYDSLTGFPKRHHFMNKFETLLNQQSSSDTKIAVGHLDITRFRRVNETLGHSAADDVIGTVADRLDQLLPDDALKTRIMGDEFLIVVPGVESEQGVRTLGNRILSELQEPISVEDQSFLFSGRFGFSMYPDTGTSAENLLRQADAALKETSTDSSSAVKMYLTEMNRSGRRAQNLERDFLFDLAKGNFTLNYQPKVDLENGSVCGMEALIRWNHPEAGFVPPPTIISLAETLGEMSNLGRWVMETACDQVRRWNQTHGTDLNLGVNVSALEFQQGDTFLQSVEETLLESELRNENLMIEITETEAMHDIDFTIDLLESLNELGITVAIDDYGTGQSSLEYLARFPDPILKIDRTFVDGVTEDSSKKAIVRSTVSLAQEMGIPVIAEGVEQEEERDFLQYLNCGYYQGYYFSKPVDAEEFEHRFLT